MATDSEGLRTRIEAIKRQAQKVIAGGRIDEGALQAVIQSSLSVMSAILAPAARADHPELPRGDP